MCADRHQSSCCQLNATKKGRKRFPKDFKLLLSKMFFLDLSHRHPHFVLKEIHFAYQKNEAPAHSKRSGWKCHAYTQSWKANRKLFVSSWIALWDKQKHSKMKLLCASVLWCFGKCCHFSSVNRLHTPILHQYVVNKWPSPEFSLFFYELPWGTLSNSTNNLIID